jgi:hypothetical protein
MPDDDKKKKKKKSSEASDGTYTVVLPKTKETKSYNVFGLEREEGVTPSHIVSVYMPKSFKGESIKVTVEAE